MAYHVTRTYKIGNDIYDVPEHEEEAFRKSLVKEKGTDTAVEPIHTFKDADKTYDVPESELPEFHKAFGDKQPERINVYKSDDGEIYDVPESEHDDFRLASGMLPQYSGPKSPGAQRQKSPQKSTVVDNISTTVHDASGASGTDSLINDPLTARKKKSPQFFPPPQSNATDPARVAGSPEDLAMFGISPEQANLDATLADAQGIQTADSDVLWVAPGVAKTRSGLTAAKVAANIASKKLGVVVPVTAKAIASKIGLSPGAAITLGATARLVGQEVADSRIFAPGENSRWGFQLGGIESARNLSGAANNYRQTGNRDHLKSAVREYLDLEQKSSKFAEENPHNFVAGAFVEGAAMLGPMLESWAESGFGMAPGASQVEAFNYWKEQGTGEAIADALRDVDVDKLSDEALNEIIATSEAGAAAYASMEFINFGWLKGMGYVPKGKALQAVAGGVKKASEKILAPVAKKLAKHPKWAQWVYRKVAEYIINSLSESGEEGLQKVALDITQNLNLNTMREDMPDEPLPKNLSAREIADNAIKEFVMTLPSIAAMGIMAGGTRNAFSGIRMALEKDDGGASAGPAGPAGTGGAGGPGGPGVPGAPAGPGGPGVPGAPTGTGGPGGPGTNKAKAIMRLKEEFSLTPEEEAVLSRSDINSEDFNRVLDGIEARHKEENIGKLQDLYGIPREQAEAIYEEPDQATAERMLTDVVEQARSRSAQGPGAPGGPSAPGGPGAPTVSDDVQPVDMFGTQLDSGVTQQPSMERAAPTTPHDPGGWVNPTPGVRPRVPPRMALQGPGGKNYATGMVEYMRSKYGDIAAEELHNALADGFINAEELSTMDDRMIADRLGQYHKERAMAQEQAKREAAFNTLAPDQREIALRDIEGVASFDEYVRRANGDVQKAYQNRQYDARMLNDPPGDALSTAEKRAARVIRYMEDHQLVGDAAFEAKHQAALNELSASLTANNPARIRHAAKRLNKLAGQYVKNRNKTQTGERSEQNIPDQVANTDQGNRVPVGQQTGPQAPVQLQGLPGSQNSDQGEAAGRPEAVQDAVKENLEKAAKAWDFKNRSDRGTEWFIGGNAEQASVDGFAEALQNGGSQLQAHGMAKEHTLSGAIKTLINLLTNGIDQSRGGGHLDSAQLVISTKENAGTGAGVGTASGMAYKDGPFILVAKNGVKTIRSVDDIGAVLVNEAHSNIAPLLREQIHEIRQDIIVDSYANAGKVTKLLMEGRKSEAADAGVQEAIDVSKTQATPPQEVPPLNTMPIDDSVQQAYIGRTPYVMVGGNWYNAKTEKPVTNRARIKALDNKLDGLNVSGKAVETPVIDFIAEEGGMIARSKLHHAKAAGEYDEAKGIKEWGGYTRLLFGSKSRNNTPDNMAKWLHAAGMLEQPEVAYLWDAIEREINAQNNKTEDQHWTDLQIEAELENLEEIRKGLDNVEVEDTQLNPSNSLRPQLVRKNDEWYAVRPVKDNPLVDVKMVDGETINMYDKVHVSGVLNPGMEGYEKALLEYKRQQDPRTTGASSDTAATSARASVEKERAEVAAQKPSEAQKEAGNYKKLHIARDGMSISIENPVGSTREGVDKTTGKKWSTKMEADYGYIKGSVGYDKDHVDVFINPEIEQDIGVVFVVNQVNPKTGKFDEHKAMLGYDSQEAAEQAYLAHYEPGWKGMQSVFEMSVDDFKEWALSDQPKKGALKEYTPPGNENAQSDTDMLDAWKKKHGIKKPAEQGEMFGKGAVGDTFNLKQETVPDNARLIAEEAKRKKAAKEAALAQELLFAGTDETFATITDLREKYGDVTREEIEGEPGAWKLIRKEDASHKASDLAGLSDAEFDALLDEVEAETKQPQKSSVPESKPETTRTPPPKSKAGIEAERIAKQERPQKERTPPPKSKAGLEKAKQEEAKAPEEIIKSAAKHGVKGIDEAAKGLFELFGGGSRMGMGVPVDFDADTYAKAKPHFEKAFAQFAAAGRDLKDFVRWAYDQFGTGIRPYLKAFRNDLSNEGSQTDLMARNIEFESEARNIITDQKPAAQKTFSVKKLAEKHNITEKETQERVESILVEMAREIATDKAKTEREKYDALLDLYAKQPRFNKRTSTSIQNQAYSTPIPLAFVANLMSGVTQDKHVYEPTAGHGVLTMLADPKKTHVNELEDGRVKDLQQKGYGQVTQQDASSYTPKTKADIVVANPPFGALEIPVNVDGYQIRKLEHLICIRAAESLKDDGVATFIVGASLQHGKTTATEAIFLNYLANHYNVVGNFEIDGSLYAAQGASYPVRVITIAGRKPGKPQMKKLAPESVQRIDNWDDLWYITSEVKDGIERNRHAVGTEHGGPGSPDNGHSAGEIIPDHQNGIPSVSAKNDRTDGQRGRGDGGPRGRTGISGKHSDSGNDFGAQLEGSESTVYDSVSNAGAGRDDLSQMDAESGNSRREKESPTVDPRTGLRGPHGGIDSSAVDRGSSSVKRRSVRHATDRQDHYDPFSLARKLDTLINRTLTRSVYKALAKLEKRVGDLDEWVSSKLNYANVDQMHKGLSGEQVDGIALAIDRIEQGGALIIGDQTGIGKGRQAAGLIRYAKANGWIPVFITADPKLFSDMHGDLKDIGSSIKPLILGDTDKSHLRNTDNVIVQKALPVNQQQSLMRDYIDGDAFSDFGYDSIFLTYSQLQNLDMKNGAEQTARQNALMKMAANEQLLVILDESHSASGQDSITGLFLRGGKTKKKVKVSNGGGYGVKQVTFNGLLKQPGIKGVCYLSATYAKRPDTMALYFKTHLGKSIKSAKKLADIFARGGIALQQAVANALAETGEYIRRERDFTGVKFDTVTASKNEQEAQNLIKKMDSTCDVLSEIATYSIYVKHAVIKLANIKAIANTEAHLKSSPFTSILHNYVSQSLLSLKTESAIAQAIEAHKHGEKPIIVVSNTMGAFIEEYSTYHTLNVGDEINLTFQDILLRALDRSMMVSEDDGAGNKTHYMMTPAQLGLEEKYQKIVKLISQQDNDMPISPIDYMIHKLQKAGLKVGEITGRKDIIEYKDGNKSIYRQRADSEITNKNKHVNAFNSGKLDVLIINRSGSTGLSLHASKEFKDQKPRHMIIAQPDLNIDTFTQTLGRILRTGLPGEASDYVRYSLLSLPLEAERRPNTVLSSKMKSLNANTTADTDTDTDVDTIDFFNKYGDKIVSEILSEDEDLARLCDISISKNKDGTVAVKPDVARKFTGRMAILPNELQRTMYLKIYEEYDEYIKELKETGVYDLEVQREESWDAVKTGETKILEHGSDKGSMFTDDLYIDTYDINDPRPMPTVQDLQNELMKNWGTTDIGKIADKMTEQFHSIMAQLDTQAETYLGEEPELSDEKWHESWVRRRESLIQDRAKLERAMATVIRCAKNGKVHVSIKGEHEDMLPLTNSGFITAVDHKETKNNPYKLSSFRIRVMLESKTKYARISLSRIDSGRTTIKRTYDKTSIDDFAKSVNNTERTSITVIGGNLIKAVESAMRGRITTFKTREGQYVTGLVMPASWTEEQLLLNPLRNLQSGDAVANLLLDNPDATVISNNQQLSFERQRRHGNFLIRVPFSKAKGAMFYLDEGLNEIVGDFTSLGKSMVVEITQQQVIDAANYVMNELEVTLTSTGVKQEAIQKANGKEQYRREKHLGDDISKLPRGEQIVIKERLKSLIREIFGADAMPENLKELFRHMTGSEMFSVVERLTDPEGMRVLGRYADSFVEVAANQSDFQKIRTTFHETWHYIEDNLLTPGQKEELTKLEPDAEKRAEQFADYAVHRLQNKTPMAARKAMNITRGVMQLLEQIYQAIRRMVTGKEYQKLADAYDQAIRGVYADKKGNLTTAGKRYTLNKTGNLLVKEGGNNEKENLIWDNGQENLREIERTSRIYRVPGIIGEAAQYFNISYVRVNADDTAVESTFMRRLDGVRVALTPREQASIKKVHDEILNHNYAVDRDASDYDSEIYAEGEIPYIDRQGRFDPSHERFYNVKFIEMLDKHNPKLATKLLSSAFEPAYPQTKDSIKITQDHWFGVPEDIEGSVHIAEPKTLQDEMNFAEYAYSRPQNDKNEDPTATEAEILQDLQNFRNLRQRVVDIVQVVEGAAVAKEFQGKLDKAQDKYEKAQEKAKAEKAAIRAKERENAKQRVQKANDKSVEKLREAFGKATGLPMKENEKSPFSFFRKAVSEGYDRGVQHEKSKNQWRGIREEILNAFRLLARQYQGYEAKHLGALLSISSVLDDINEVNKTSTDPEAALNYTRTSLKTLFGEEKYHQLRLATRGNMDKTLAELEGALQDDLGRVYARNITKLMTKNRVEKLYSEELRQQWTEAVKGLATINQLQKGIREANGYYRKLKVENAAPNVLKRQSDKIENLKKNLEDVFAKMEWRTSKDIYENLSQIVAVSKMQEEVTKSRDKARRGIWDTQIAGEIQHGNQEILDTADGTPPSRPGILQRLRDARGSFETWVLELIGSDEGTVGYEVLYDNIRVAQNYAESAKHEARQKLKESLKQHGVGLRQLAQWRSKRITVNLGGYDHKFTAAELMELYAYTLDPEAEQKLMKNGFKRGAKRLLSVLSRDYIYDPEYPATTANIVSYLTSRHLTDAQRGIVEDLVKIVTDLGNAGNKTSQRIFGHEKFLSDSHWRIKTDRQGGVKFNFKDPEAFGKLSGRPAETLTALGMLRERVPHSNPLVLGDIFQSFEDQVNEMANFTHKAVPVLDLINILNGRHTSNAIAERLGSRYLYRMRSYIGRIAGTDSYSDDWSSISRKVGQIERDIVMGILGFRITSKWKNRIGGSILMQSELAKVSPKAAALFTANVLPVDLKSKTNAPIVEKLLANGFFAHRWMDDPIRTFGNLPVDTEYMPKTQYELIRRWIQMKSVRGMAVAEMRNAVNAYKALMKAGIAEDKVIEQVEIITRRTQNPSTPLEESGIYSTIKRTGPLASIFVPFYGQPSVAANMLVHDYMALRNKKDGKSALNFVRTLQGLLLNAAFSVAIGQIVRQVIRGRLPVGDDEEEREQQILFMRTVGEVLDVFAPGAGRMSDTLVTAVYAAKEYMQGDSKDFAGALKIIERALKGAEGDMSEALPLRLVASAGYGVANISRGMKNDQNERIEKGVLQLLDVLGGVSGMPISGVAQRARLAHGATEVIGDVMGVDVPGRPLAVEPKSLAQLKAARADILQSARQIGADYATTGKLDKDAQIDLMKKANEYNAKTKTEKKADPLTTAVIRSRITAGYRDIKPKQTKEDSEKIQDIPLRPYVPAEERSSSRRSIPKRPGRPKRL